MPSQAQQLVGSGHRGRVAAAAAIREIRRRLRLPRAIERKANGIFLLSSAYQILCDQNTEAVAVVSLYLACRKRGLSTTLNRICRHSQVGNKRLIWRCFNLITGLCYSGDATQPDADDIAAIFCEVLGVSQSSQRRATFIASEALRLNLVPGEAVQALAAAAVFLALKDSDTPMSARTIARICQLRAPPIVRTHSRLMPHSRLLLSPQNL
jgi:transcription initiation factor TFIIIB Brf1 subunit/transcription initiation factor TFIIB